MRVLLSPLVPSFPGLGSVQGSPGSGQDIRQQFRLLQAVVLTQVLPNPVRKPELFHAELALEARQPGVRIHVSAHAVPPHEALAAQRAGEGGFPGMQPHVLLISTPAVVHFVTLLALEMKLLLVDEFFVNHKRAAVRVALLALVALVLDVLVLLDVLLQVVGLPEVELTVRTHVAGRVVRLKVLLQVVLRG